jgi:Ca2+-binding RTX toxin-like protein
MAVLAALAPSVAMAATPKCFGKKATIVSNKSEINGTKKDDVIVSKSRSGLNFIDGKGGNDLICGGPEFDFIFGGPGNDKSRGRGGIDFHSGDAGNDHFYADSNDGGQADDAYYQFSTTAVNVNMKTGRATGQGTDTLHGMDGVFGSHLNDTITGDGGTNFIWGNGGDDVINGGAGLDLIDPGDGNDTSNGGTESNPAEDIDIYYVSGATGPAQVDLQAGTSSGEGIGSDTHTDFENVVGGNYDDELSGDDGSNILFGGPGDDSLIGRGDFDYASYWFAAGRVNANLQTNSSTSDSVPNPDPVEGEPADVGEGSDSYQSLEGLLGSIEHNDTLTGDNQSNYLDGDGGTDTISAGGGDDWIVGGNGSNEQVDGGAGTNDFWDYFGFDALNINLVAGTITGQTIGTVQITGVESVAGADQADTFVGDAANNTFYGWAGNDTFTGGAGADRFHGGAGSDTATTAEGSDSCYQVETLAGCAVAPQEIPQPQLSTAASVIETLRRNF